VPIAARTVKRGLYVQYGCGLCAPDAWLNFDASPRLRIERIHGLRMLLRATAGILFPPTARPGDIVRGLPVPDGTADGVYCSHVLEHLPRDDVPIALRNTFRMLQPGGAFRLVVPDLQWRVRHYLDDAARADPSAADRFLESSALGARSRPRMPAAAIRRLIGQSAHLWMYDFAALARLLAEAGFGCIRRCTIGDSGDPAFALVEQTDRFSEAGESELAIEARRLA
jgi:SAM-dependent methyltransferase